MKWQPIETAPKDRYILLYIEFLGVICGHWENDGYAKNPKPYWTNDLELLFGKKGCRWLQPTHWMPLPEAPFDERKK